MIPRNDIIAWGLTHPWPDSNQIEQDLLLSKAMCEISNDTMLSDELALRGGTALHKLIMPKPYRYSEDLDYVRTKEGGIGDIMTRLTELGQELGFSVKTRFGMFPKVLWKYNSERGIPSWIKIEINTYERQPVCGFNYINHVIASDYYEGKARIRSFMPEELIATKIRALYQRSKGRDLYDLWMALNAIKVSPLAVKDVFSYYRPAELKTEDIIINLREKMSDTMFMEDIYYLLRHDAPEYDAVKAVDYVITELLSKL